MYLKNSIKTIGIFQKTVNILYGIITFLRVLAVLFLILQTVVLIFGNENSINLKSLNNQ